MAEYWGVDPADIDIMMGTFTKSFGASGGYIAATHVSLDTYVIKWTSLVDLQEIVSHIRAYSHATTYATGMPGPVAQQIISSMSIIMGKDGTDEGKLLTHSQREAELMSSFPLQVKGESSSLPRTAGN